MESERLIGIVLHVTDSTTAYPSDHTYKISLRIGHSADGKPFITSPTIRRAIQKTKLMPGRPIGRIEFLVDHARNVITSHDVKPTSLLHGRNKELFQKIGLSTRVELAIEKMFKKQFPNYALRSTANPSAARAIQLQKRGRSIGDPISIAVAHELTRQAALKQFHEHRDDVKRVREREKRRLRLLATMRRRAI